MLKTITLALILTIAVTAEKELKEFNTNIHQPIRLEPCTHHSTLVGNHDEVEIMKHKGKSTILSFNSSVQQFKCLSTGLVAIATAEVFYLFDLQHHINSSLPLNGSFPMAISEDPHNDKLYLLAIKNKTAFTELQFQDNELHQFDDEDLQLGRNIMAVSYVYHHDFIFVSDYERNLNIYEEPFESKDILRIDGLTAPAHLSPLANTTSVLVYDNTGNFAIVKDGKVTMKNLRTHYHLGALCKNDSFVLANNQQMEVHWDKKMYRILKLGSVADFKDIHCSVSQDGDLTIDLLDVKGVVKRFEIQHESSTNWLVIIVCVLAIGGLLYWLKQKCFTKEEDPNQGLMSEEMVDRH